MFLAALVLTSALLHALWNALLKRAADIEAASLGILAISFLATGAVSALLPGPAFPTGASLAWGLGAGVFEGLYFLALARALGTSPLGWSYTWMRGGSLLVVWPVSLLLLGESLRLTSALAVGAVGLGLAFMGLVPGRGADRGRRGQGSSDQFTFPAGGNPFAFPTSTVPNRASYFSRFSSMANRRRFRCFGVVITRARTVALGACGCT